MEHEVFLLLALVRLEALSVVGGAQGGGDQGLCFATGKERGTVGAGQDAGLDADGADFVEGAAVGTNAFPGDLLAEDALAEKLVIGGEFFLGAGIVGGEVGCELILDLFDEGVAGGFVVGLGVEGVLEAIADLRLELVVIALVDFGSGDDIIRKANRLPKYRQPNVLVAMPSWLSSRD